MDKLYVTMIKDILNKMSSQKLSIDSISYNIGITTNTLIEYLSLEKKDFSMYLLILDTIKEETANE